MTQSIFNKTPSTVASSQVPATNVSNASNGQRSRFHYIEQIFNPDVHSKDEIQLYVVPNEGELIFDVPNGRIYFASHVDVEGDYKTTLSPWAFNNVTEEATYDQDTIFGVRGGPLAGEAMLSIDYSVRPNVARVDATIMRPGAAYALVYRGNDVSKNGTIISAQYDTAGNLLSNRVPTVLAALSQLDNRTIFTTGGFSVTANSHELEDGARCTLVFFDEGGNFIPPVQPLMVSQTAYLRDHSVAMKYVKTIELISPWFTDSTNAEKILLPINTVLSSIEFRGKVVYSDNTFEILPVNGDRFALEGVSEYRPKYPGQTAELVLIYKFSPDEQAYMAEPGSPFHMKQLYTIEATALRGAYSPKLYTVPQWDFANSRYMLKHYLYDLDREIRRDVTQHVSINEQSPVWAGTLYGVEQNMIFNINLRDVSPAYESYIHVQHTTIVLLGNFLVDTAQWRIKYDYTKPAYTAFKLPYVPGSNYDVDFSGFESKEALLNALYWPVLPSYITFDETQAPTPTHVLFETLDGNLHQFNLDNWETPYRISSVVNKGYTHNLYWLRSLPGGQMLQLAMTGVTPKIAEPK